MPEGWHATLMLSDAKPPDAGAGVRWLRCWAGAEMHNERLIALVME